jgi:hypothetical protein
MKPGKCLNQDEWDDRMTRMLIQDIVGNHYPFHPFILYIQVLKERREETKKRSGSCALRAFFLKCQWHALTSSPLIFSSSSLLLYLFCFSQLPSFFISNFFLKN